MDNSKEYIVCAAIRRIEPHSCVRVLKNVDLYDIEIGLRHADILHRFQGIVSKAMKDQGFITSKGRWVDRIEGMQIAIACEQVIPGTTPNDKRLFSEDIY